MRKNLLRLDVNLFGAKMGKSDINEKPKNFKQKTVKDLIVELDNAVGNFVGSPIFQNANVINEQASEKAQQDLQRIMKLSDALSNEAKTMR